ncbi:MAG: hypothetical protein BHW15_03650 [Coprococcus sp. CAG:131_42_139]|jgi:NADH pyrophosphatase NudC (nudix superfamily)|nr:MAG: hypothetical protein BHW15_03650 [Coprococcus sp. CAG:131_42_139]DAZ19855.1 MAG TPA: Thaumarchaeal output domain 1 [Caudoviricetes sp.]
MKEYLVGMVCTECDQGEIEYNSIIKKYECTCCDAKFDEEELTTSQAYLDRDEKYPIFCPKCGAPLFYNEYMDKFVCWDCYEIYPGDMFGGEIRKLMAYKPAICKNHCGAECYPECITSCRFD